jgi:hypothetical protein
VTWEWYETQTSSSSQTAQSSTVIPVVELLPESLDPDPLPSVVPLVAAPVVSLVSSAVAPVVSSGSPVVSEVVVEGVVVDDIVPDIDSVVGALSVPSAVSPDPPPSSPHPAEARARISRNLVRIAADL